MKTIEGDKKVDVHKSRYLWNFPDLASTKKLGTQEKKMQNLYIDN